MNRYKKVIPIVAMRLCLALIFSGTSFAYDASGTNQTFNPGEQNFISLKLLAEDTSLLIGNTVRLKAQFSGPIRPCTDSLCTATLYRYINDTADSSDDSALTVTLQSVTHQMQLMPDDNRILLYVATYDVKANEIGTHSVHVRVNGTLRGQFKISKKDFTVMPADCTQKIGKDGKIYMDCDRNDEVIVDNDEQDDDWPQVCTPEVCDGIDNDCDNEVDETGCDQPNNCVPALYHLDLDGDGYGGSLKDVMACEPPAGYVTDGSDCDDHNYTIHPGATEICDDGIDNDCDGTMDEGCITPPVDKDQDGYPVDEDCDDNNAAVYPGTEEICDGLDNDCNGQIDDSESCTDQAPVITPNINESPLPTAPPVGPFVPVTPPQPAQANQLSGGYMLGGSGCQLDKNTTAKHRDPLPVILSSLLFLLVVPRWLTHKLINK